MQLPMEYNAPQSSCAGAIHELPLHLTHEERRVIALLRRGKQNAVQVRVLSASMNIPEVEIRALVRHLIMEHGILIASSVSKPPGFYIAETAEEIQAATKSLRHRGIMILMRAAKLQRISIEEIFHQARIEFNNGRIQAVGDSRGQGQ